MTSLTLKESAYPPRAAVGLCGWAPVPVRLGRCATAVRYRGKAARARRPSGHAGCLSLRLVRRSASIRPTTTPRPTPARWRLTQTAPSPALRELGYTPQELDAASTCR